MADVFMFGVQAMDSDVVPDADEVVDVTVDQLLTAAANFTAPFEGFRSFVYDDATGKVWASTVTHAGKATFGYGHLLKAGEDVTATISQSDAVSLLAIDMRDNFLPVIPFVHVPLTLSQWIAIADLAYNWGPGNVKKSDFLQALNNYDYAGAEAGYKSIVKARINGVLQTVRGLVNRRNAAWALFENNEPFVRIV